MTKFETIGIQHLNDAYTKGYANKCYKISCSICCNRGMKIECDSCAIAQAYQQTIAAIDAVKRD